MPKNKSAFIIEICANSVESAIQAQLGGANRIELCDNLMEGGTTPSIGMIKCAVKNLDIPINVIIRPRGGDFCYSEIEFESMLNDIFILKETGINGVVVGVLKPDGSIDLERCKKLIDAARPLEITFHRAFDMVKNPFQSLEDIISMGIERLLTSGLQQTAQQGSTLISELNRLANGRLIIMPGSGINENSISELIQTTACREYHMSLRTPINGPMIYRPTHITLSAANSSDEFSTMLTDTARVQKIRNLMDNFSNKI